MTHTLHRRGMPEDLRDDVCLVFCPARGINGEGSGEKAKVFLDIVKKHGAVNYGDDLTGNLQMLGHEGLKNNARDMTNIHAVFADKDQACMAIKEIVAADLGISVVVSGLFDVVAQCCRRSGGRAHMHTIEHSLGIWGATEKLPADEVLEVSTMCGHGLVGVSLIEDTVKKIRAGRMTARQGAERLAGLCLCGVFNPVRAEALLSKLAGDA